MAPIQLPLLNFQVFRPKDLFYFLNFGKTENNLISAKAEKVLWCTTVWPVPLAQVWTGPHPQLIFPSKTWFLRIYLTFQRQKSLKNEYLPHSESKSYQINSINFFSSRSFQQHQRHIPIPSKFSARI